MTKITALFIAALGGLAACSSGSDECVAVSPECTPLYAPTFENVFTNTLQQRCGVPGVACHAREGAKGGLVFVDIDESYALLTGANGGPSRVDSAELGCGELVSRVASDDPSRVMPPAAPLGDAELCSIIQWVAGGAQR